MDKIVAIHRGFWDVRLLSEPFLLMLRSSIGTDVYILLVVVGSDSESRFNKAVNYLINQLV